MMNTISRSTGVMLLAFLIILPCNGNNIHHYPAKEWDVVSPQGTPCETSQPGFYGRSAKFETIITYQYELTVVDGEYLQDALYGIQGRSVGSEPAGLQGVFGAIETGIATALLDSEVFDSVCETGTARGPYKNGDYRKLLQNSNRQMRAVGISSNPHDQVLEGVACQVFVNETSDGPCMVVDGEFVIYLDIYEDLEETMADLLFDLFNEKHQLDSVHPYIQKVRYVDLSANVVPGNLEEGQEDPEPPSGNSSTLSSSAYVIAAAGAFIVVVGTAVFYRRRRRAEMNGLDEATTLPGQSQLNENPSLQ